MSIDTTSVLVIDDDPVSRELLLLLLRRQGYPVQTADSGAQALEYLRAQTLLTTNVILADLQMPGICGERLAGALREICGDRTRLVAMSGSSPDEAAVLGYDAFLRKPFTMDQFAAAIAGHRSADPTPSSAEPNANEEAPPIDHAVYQKLTAAMAPEQLEQLYSFCLDDVKKRIAAMRQSAAHADDTSFRQQAHAIKGGCGMVGASELQKLATILENNGLAANHVATLDEILLACERLERILNARRDAAM